MAAKKGGLGRGLDSLFVESDSATGTKPSALPLAEIEPDKAQPRKHFAPESLAELAQSIQEHVRSRMPQWRLDHDGVENMTLAVMGCVVNGPGESKHANIGISLPGTGEVPAAPVFEDGAKTVTLRGDRIAEDFTAIVDAYVARTYQRKPTGR